MSCGHFFKYWLTSIFSLSLLILQVKRKLLSHFGPKSLLGNLVITKIETLGQKYGILVDFAKIGFKIENFLSGEGKASNCRKKQPKVFDFTCNIDLLRANFDFATYEFGSFSGGLYLSFSMSHGHQTYRTLFPEHIERFKHKKLIPKIFLPTLFPICSFRVC